MLMPVSRNSDEGPGERPAKVGLHYEVIRKIGEGSFGVIYLGKSDLAPDLVAIKFESRKSTAPQLRDEYRAYKLLHNSAHKEGGMSVVGFPRVYYFGQESLFNYLIIDYLGPSLEDLFDRCGRRFSVKTVCYLAIEMISRVRTIHETSLIYRDIKPDNFLLDRRSDRIFVVDFGMVKHYRDPKTLQHIPYREKKSLSGTARYMSINTHLGREQSRRDDLEALGNVFLYFLRGSLPWQGLKARDNREKYEKIGQKKQSIRVEDLCHELPGQFAAFLTYARQLAFEEEPNYDQCISWFKDVLATVDPGNSTPLDWANLSRDWEDDVLMTQPRSTGAHYESPRLTAHHIALSRNTPEPPRRHGAAAAPGQSQPQSNLYRSNVAAPHRTITVNAIESPISDTNAIKESKRGFFRRLFCL